MSEPFAREDFAGLTDDEFEVLQHLHGFGGLTDEEYRLYSELVAVGTEKRDTQ